MSHRSLIRLVPVFMLAALALGAAPDAAPEGAMPQTGAFPLHITERSKLSAIATIVTRMGWGTMEQVKAAAQKDGREFDYNLSGESFEAFVPEGYSGAEPYGLIVWISPGPRGSPPQDWLDVLRKHKLIWVGANHSENDRAKWVRVGLAIDAAEHMQKTYKIDPLRVYVSGASGGGRISSMTAIAFPDVFTGGGYPIIGCDYYRLVELPPGPDGRPTFYKRMFERPAAKLLALAQKERRFALLTGDTDANHPQTQAYYDAMKKDGFKYVTYLQVPGMGHQQPNAEWFEKGIVSLDEARDEVAKAQKQQPPPPGEEKRPAPAQAVQAKAASPATAAPAPAPTDEDAGKLMRLAKLYLDNRLYAKAREKLNQVVKDYPKSTEAVEAKKLLKEIGTK